eukprot:Em0022g663a
MSDAVSVSDVVSMSDVSVRDVSARDVVSVRDVVSGSDVSVRDVVSGSDEVSGSDVVTVNGVMEFTPNYNVQVDDPENEFPVPTTRQSTQESLFLYLAIWWVVFVLLVYTLNSRPARSCLQYLRTLRRREKVD